jgi:hypothetical protein
VCGVAQPYGYIGETVSGVNLGAVVNGSPTDTQVAAHFQIWPVDSPASVTDLTSIALPPGGQVGVTVANSAFTDGATYAWRVRDETSTQVSDWTAPCHFIRILIPPPAPAVTSSTFPATGATPIRTFGTFTFTVPAPTRVVGFNYILNGQLAVAGNPFVAIGADGTATTPPLASARFGTNFIQAQSVDIAGDVSQPVFYSFSLVDNRTGPDRHSDLNGDGNADLAAVSGDGKLYIALGRGDGAVSQPTASPLPAPQSQASAPLTWNPSLVALGGDMIGEDGFEDMAVIQNGRLALFQGDGLGGFLPDFTLGDPPADAADWSGVTRLVSPGDLDGTGSADLLAVQNGRLMFFPGQFAAGFFAAPVQAVPGAWSGSTVVGVTDVTGDGKPDLIARADASGVLWAYPGNGDGTFSPARIRVGSGLPSTRYPLLVTKGDVTGDANPDIWAVGVCGNLYLVKGRPGGRFGAPALVSTSPFWKTVTTLG